MSTTGPEPAHGHSVVCGVDHLGLRTVEELRLRDEEVVAIGPTADTEEWLAEHGVRLIVGDHRAHEDAARRRHQARPRHRAHR